MNATESTADRMPRSVAQERFCADDKKALTATCQTPVGRYGQTCGGTSVDLLPRAPNGQRRLECAKCQAFIKHVGKVHTGEARESLRSRPDISTEQRARIMDRDGRRCILCQKTPISGLHSQLVIAHMVSVKYGRAAGIPDRDLFADWNLFTCCAECNDGHGEQVIPTPIAILILRARKAQEENKR